MNFSDLIVAISDAHGLFYTEASKAINIYTTLRNWLIGAYVQEYEQKGTDRAQYGVELLGKLAKRLKKQNISGMFSKKFTSLQAILSDLSLNSAGNACEIQK